MRLSEKSFIEALERANKRVEKEVVSVSYQDLVAALQGKSIANNVAKSTAKAGKLAVASLMGKVTASKEQSNPYKLNLDLFITDFAPNDNKMAVAESEASNIITSGIYTPLRANFNGSKLLGHDNAESVGVITEITSVDNALRGKAYIWKEHNTDLAYYLLDNPDKVYTSWEIYYSESEIDSNGVEWLKDVSLSGCALVDVPAYGTRALGKIVE